MEKDELDLEQLNNVLGGVSFDKGLESFMNSNIPPEEKRAKLEEMKKELSKLDNGDTRTSRGK